MNTDSQSSSDSTSTASHFSGGQSLAGTYVLRRQITAAGAFAPIWAADDEVLGKDVSLHFLPTSLLGDAEVMDRIRQAVKRTRQLIHPSILRVHDLVEEDAWAALSMEAFTGESLASTQAENLDLGKLQPWLAELSQTLDEAHAIHFVHGDVAAENIFVDPSGKLTLAYFGVSRVVQDALAGKDRKSASPRFGSVSPQVWQGQAPTRADDVYGFGALLFKFLAGEDLFAGADLATAIPETAPKSVSATRAAAGKTPLELPAAVEETIAACLSKDLAARPASVGEAFRQVEASGVFALGAATIPVAEPELVLESTPAPVVVEAPVEAEVPKVSETPLVLEPAVVAPVAAELVESVEQSVPSESVAVEPPPAEPVAVVSAAPETPAAKESAPTPAPKEPLQVLPASTELVIKQAKQSAESKPAPKTRITPIAPLKPQGSGFGATALAAAAVLVVVGLAAYQFGGSSKPQSAPGITTTDRTEGTELSTVNNTLPAFSNEKPVADKPVADKPIVDKPINEKAASIAAEPPQSLASATSTPAMVVAAVAPKPTATPVVRSTPAPAPVAAVGLTGTEDKAVALEKVRQAVAAADKSRDDLLKQKQAADAAAVEAQKTYDDKFKATEPTRKVSQERAALRKQLEDEQKSAELVAQQAQQLAAEKARAAEASKKALADLDSKSRETTAVQERADAELQALQKKVAEKQLAATESGKALGALEQARQQQAATLQQLEQDVANSKAAQEKAAAAEAEKKRLADDTERRKLDEELASMRAMFEQKMKDLETRRQQLASGAAPAPAPASTPQVAPPVVAQANKPVATPKPLATPLPTPLPTPIATPVAVATPDPTQLVKLETPKATPPLSTGTQFQNSLGMKFAPVGDTLFCVWQTRVKDFEVFARAVNLKSTAWQGPGFKQGPDHPVVNVTWNEAIAFCKWLTEKERKDGVISQTQFYRLPYDLEWSAAVGLPDEPGKNAEARDMGIPDVYPWGTAWPPPAGSGNYTGEETGSDVAIKGYDDSFPWTSPVGSFPANKFGLFDMGGNVWQWCMDSWNAESKAKVLRGASWYNGALKLSLLSSCRVHASPDSSTDNYGFRIVRVNETPRTPKK